MRLMKHAMLIALATLLVMPGAVFGAKKWEKIKSEHTQLKGNLPYA